MLKQGSSGGIQRNQVENTWPRKLGIICAYQGKREVLVLRKVKSSVELLLQNSLGWLLPREIVYAWGCWGLCWGCPIWRAIEKAKKIVAKGAKGACYLIGDGQSVNVWRDPWVSWIDDYMPRPRDDSISLDPLMVTSLIDSSTHCWKQEKLTEQLETDYRPCECNQKNPHSNTS